jgi:hypothetical protein
LDEFFAVGNPIGETIYAERVRLLEAACEAGDGAGAKGTADALQDAMERDS